MCTVIDLLRILIEEQRVLIKIEFNRATIMFELLCASIESVRTNCVPNGTPGVQAENTANTNCISSHTIC